MNNIKELAENVASQIFDVGMFIVSLVICVFAIGYIGGSIFVYLRLTKSQRPNCERCGKGVGEVEERLGGFVLQWRCNACSKRIGQWV